MKILNIVKSIVLLPFLTAYQADAIRCDLSQAEIQAIMDEAADLGKILSDEVMAEIIKKTPSEAGGKGKWLKADGTPGDRGNSFWESNKPEVLALNNGKPIRISYNNGFPNFDKWSKLDVTFPDILPGKRRDDNKMLGEWLTKNGAPDGTRFDNKTQALKWVARNKLAVHHKPDGKTLQLVPRAIHEANGHIGGHRLIEILRNK